MIKLVLKLYLFIAGNCFNPSRLREKQHAANIVESRLAMDELEPVIFEGGTSGSSSPTFNFWNQDWSARRAFQRQSPAIDTDSRNVDSRPWKSADISADGPQTVYYQFKETIAVAKFGFRNRREKNRNFDPTAFDFIGSDDCQSWTTILPVDGVSWTDNDEFKSWDIKESRIFKGYQRFKCFGIRVRAATSERGSTAQRACIQDLRMWKMPGANQVDCHRSRMDAFTQWLTDPNIWIPKCNGKYFSPMQTNIYTIKDGEKETLVKQAFCVNKWGEEYKESRVNGETADCEKYTKDVMSCISGTNSNSRPWTIRVVSWNVADNKYMHGEMPYKMMPKDAIEKLLGLSDNDDDNDKVADIFAVGLQEQCWHCNLDRMLDIPKEFLQRLSEVGDFEIVGIEGTRESNTCESGCKKEKSDHGTTALFVIARRGVVIKHSSSHFVSGCSTRNNNEKGLAYMKLVLKTGQSVCVATNHLESREPKWRRECLKGFFEDAAKTLDWASDCDFHFISGDFNTRTAEKTKGKKYIFDQSKIPSLKTVDEMLGSAPWSSDDEWAGNLLTYINDITIPYRTYYRESPLDFLPTYKLEAKKPEESYDIVCGDRRPCYREDRPQSWTDRILHSSGTSLEYNSIHLEYSDHDPVYEVFQLPRNSSEVIDENKPVAIAFFPTAFHIYKTKGKTWNEARQACQENGGDLASLAANKDIDSIWPFVPEEDVTISGDRFTWTGGYWVGAVKKTVVGSQPPRKHWFWLTGEPIHPSMDSDGGDCAAYHKRKGDSKATITDDKCNEKRPGYICQFNSKVEQNIIGL